MTIYLKKMIEELEDEVTQTRGLVSKIGSDEMKQLKENNQKLEEELKNLQTRFDEKTNEIRK